MGCSCHTFQATADLQFDAKKAAAEARAYRRGRLRATTRLLRDAIVATGLNRGTLLDVGAGIGALTLELLNGGVSRAVIAEASGAFADAAREEAGLRGRSASVQVVRGDIVEIAAQLPAADLVTLDRVVCCYPRYEPLLDEAARHATRGVALSYPRDRWYVRAVMGLENVLRRRTSAFRTFIHPPDEMQRLLERSGFTLVSRSGTLVWSIDVFVRAAGTARFTSRVKS